MKSRLALLMELLHTAEEAALATHGVSLPGYPFASVAPFVPDASHCPVMLMSGLAEHALNLSADARASLVVSRILGAGETARITLIGEIRPIEPTSSWVERYVRYHPAAERFLALGDFHFRRMEPLKIRVVGGFAQAGWLDGNRLTQQPALAPAAEAALLAALDPARMADTECLGIDRFGLDYRRAGRRLRYAFPAGPLAAEALAAALARFDPDAATP